MIIIINFLLRWALVATFMLAPFFSTSQLFKNLDFEKLCDSSKTGFCAWRLSWGGNTACTPASSGKNHYLLIKGSSEQSVGFAEQEAFIPKGDMRILRVTATIRANNIQGRGAGLNIGIYDGKGGLITSKDMGGFYSLKWIKGTRSWKTYTIETISPAEAASIKIGAILYGKGNAMFDNYVVQLSPLKGRKPSRIAQEYISAACDTIDKHSLVRDSINIAELKNKALQIAGDAKSYKDCHLAISYLLESLRPYGDHHSFFMDSEEVRTWENATTPATEISYPESKIIEGFGYITVPPFHGGNPRLIKAYSDSLQFALRKLDEMKIKGWIVDLRQNTGGNMSPMIAGLGPLFDKEIIGSLVNVEGKVENWSYKDGNYNWDSDTILSVSKPVKLSAQLPIAVLIGPRTGSSGEIVVLSFVGNAKTRLFGEPTWGLTTGNGSFDLPDKSRMMLASTIMADRNGKLYRGPIPPDVAVSSKINAGKDPALDAAINWLLLGGKLY